MKLNEAGWDRLLRVIVGLFLLSMLLWVEGKVKYVGLVGFVPLITGIVGWCPLYSLLGISTCRLKGAEEKKT